ncbi:MAG: HYR domain-containing protein [Patiriisocius sp.]|uniref:HYR domain-containing protein n=1 Tax=Patiriisocius sp. TaxID=2822396 RepID=UPI003EF2F144
MKNIYAPYLLFVVLFSLSTFILNATPLVAINELSIDNELCNISITCPSNRTESATPTCSFQIPDYTGLVMISDACMPPTISQSPLAGTIVGLGIYTITVTADDGTNIEQCSFDISVIDTTSPTLTCPIDQVEVFDENCQFIVPDYTSLASATDSCSVGSIPITQNPAPGTVVSGTTTIFLFATDDAGNTGACLFDVIASDITPPTIVCPADRNENTNNNCEFVIPDYSNLATANDNCGTPVFSQIPVPGTIVGLGTTLITMTASDGMNGTSCTFNITVVDNLPPIVDCPENLLENFDANCEFVLPDYTGLANVTDACDVGPYIFSQNPPAGTTVTGDTTVTIFAEDNVGNIGSCSFQVIQNDIIPPTITCPSNQTEEVNANNCMFILPDYTGLATAMDNCNPVTITQNPPIGSLVGLGTSTITLTANDGSNDTTCTFEIEVQDTTMPNAVCASPFNVSLDANGVATITAADVDGGSNDFCGIAQMTIDVNSFKCENLGANTVVLTVEDIYGNISSCSTTVNVQDPLFVCDEPPTALCQPVVVSANENCEGEATAADFDAGSFDPDGMPTVITVSPAGPYPLGVTTVTLTIDDGTFSDSCTTTITVEDNTPPTMTCLNNQIESTTSNCEFVIPDYRINAAASDNCSMVSVTQTPAPGTVVSLGTTLIEIIADDGSNQLTCSFNLDVIDDTLPTAVCQNIVVQLDANGTAVINANDIDAGSSDNCGTVTLAINNDIFNCNDIGENTVILTVTDNAGITSECNAIVNVEDNIAPQVFCQNINVVLDANNEAQITAADIDAGSFDNCGIDTYSLDITDFDCSMVGDNTVTLTVTDASGNVSSCTATVTVQDMTPPTMTCLDDQTEGTTANCEFTIPDYRLDVMASDNCSTLSVTQTPTPGTVVSLGTTLIEIIADDGSNQLTCSFNLDVIDDTAPMAICQNITVQLDANGIAMIAPSDVDGGSADNCGAISTAIDINTFTCNDIGENTVVFTVTDNAGITSECNAIVTVEDNLAPQVSCQNMTVVLDANNQAQITVADINTGSTDNCGIASYELNITDFDCSMVGENTVILTVTDVNGNAATCSAIVTVQDNQLPVASCQNITVQLDEYGIATISPSDLDNGSTDNCANFTFSVDIDMFDCSNLGDNPVVFTITDVQGNTASCNAMVTVEDVLPPVLNCQNITRSLNSDYQVIIDIYDISVDIIDNCSVVSTDISVDTFNCSNIGENEVTITAVDQSGNESTCTVTVMIEEGVFAPNAVCESVTVPLQQDGTGTVMAIDFDAGSTGVRCFNGFSIDRDTFTCDDIGAPIQIEFTVTNAAGQTDTCIAFVNVIDGLAPQVFCPEDQYVTSTGPYSLPDYIATGLAIATDNCAVLSTSQDPDPGTLLEQGAHIITITAQDMNGFEEECEFTLYVDDTLGAETPQASLETLVMYPNPANQIINISNPQFVAIDDVTIYDISGRAIIKQRISEMSALFTIDVSNLQSATYVVVISSKNGQIVKQLAKE